MCQLVGRSVRRCMERKGVSSLHGATLSTSIITIPNGYYGYSWSDVMCRPASQAATLFFDNSTWRHTRDSTTSGPPSTAVHCTLCPPIMCWYAFFVEGVMEWTALKHTVQWRSDGHTDHPVLTSPRWPCKHQEEGYQIAMTPPPAWLVQSIHWWWTSWCRTLPTPSNLPCHHPSCILQLHISDSWSQAKHG